MLQLPIELLINHLGLDTPSNGLNTIARKLEHIPYSQNTGSIHAFLLSFWLPRQ